MGGRGPEPGGGGGGSAMPTALLGPPKSPPSLGLPSHPLTPLLLALLIPYTLHLTPSAHPGRCQHSAAGKGQCVCPPAPAPPPSPTGHLLSCPLQALPHLGPLSRCPNLGSQVGLSSQQGCSQTQQLTDTILPLPLGAWRGEGSRHPGATLVPQTCLATLLGPRFPAQELPVALARC